MNGMGTTDGDADEVIRRERLLLDPAVRASAEQVLALLHPDFVEFGASGQRWDGPGVVAALVAETPPADEPAAQLSAIATDRLADDVILLTYTVRRRGGTSRRSSVWVRGPERGWLLRFHQGTLVG
jgi:hypothetical protein